MAKTAKNTAPAVEKKTKVNKGIAKPKPAQKSVAKKAAPGGISGKYSGIKEKKPKATAAVSEAPVSHNALLCPSHILTFPISFRKPMHRRNQNCPRNNPARALRAVPW